MSGRLVKEVLKILEESKHQWNPDGTEEDELGDSGGLFLCNRFENFPIEDNEGHIEETEIYVETNVQPEVKDSSKKNKGKEIDYTWDETLEDNVEEVEALGDSSKGASSLLEIVPKYLNLEKQMTAVYGSDLARSLENRRHGRYGEQRRGSRAAYHPKNTVLTPVLKNWPTWDRSFSMEFIEDKSGLNYFKYKHLQAYEDAQLMLQAAQNNYANDFKAAVEEILLRCPYHTESLITLAEICESKGQREGVSDAIRRCVYAFERAWHPLFTPFEGNCRLSCTYVENKQFFRCFLARIKMMDCAGIQKSGFETF